MLRAGEDQISRFQCHELADDRQHFFAAVQHLFRRRIDHLFPIDVEPELEIADYRQGFVWYDMRPNRLYSILAHPTNEIDPHLIVNLVQVSAR
jgi:hypothetical protein